MGNSHTTTSNNDDSQDDDQHDSYSSPEPGRERPRPRRHRHGNGEDDDQSSHGEEDVENVDGEGDKLEPGGRKRKQRAWGRVTAGSPLLTSTKVLPKKGGKKKKKDKGKASVFNASDSEQEDEATTTGTSKSNGEDETSNEGVSRREAWRKSGKSHSLPTSATTSPVKMNKNKPTKKEKPKKGGTTPPSSKRFKTAKPSIAPLQSEHVYKIYFSETDVHRLTIEATGIDDFRSQLEELYSKLYDPNKHVLQYPDADGDLCTLSTQREWDCMLRYVTEAKAPIIRIFVRVKGAPPIRINSAMLAANKTAGDVTDMTTEAESERPSATDEMSSLLSLLAQPPSSQPSSSSSSSSIPPPSFAPADADNRGSILGTYSTWSRHGGRWTEFRPLYIGKDGIRLGSEALAMQGQPRQVDEETRLELATPASFPPHPNPMRLILSFRAGGRRGFYWESDNNYFVFTGRLNTNAEGQVDIRGIRQNTNAAAVNEKQEQAEFAFPSIDQNGQEPIKTDSVEGMELQTKKERKKKKKDKRKQKKQDKNNKHNALKLGNSGTLPTISATSQSAPLVRSMSSPSLAVLVPSTKSAAQDPNVNPFTKPSSAEGPTLASLWNEKSDSEVIPSSTPSIEGGDSPAAWPWNLFSSLPSTLPAMTARLLTNSMSSSPPRITPAPSSSLPSSWKPWPSSTTSMTTMMTTTTTPKSDELPFSLPSVIERPSPATTSEPSVEASYHGVSAKRLDCMKQLIAMGFDKDEVEMKVGLIEDDHSLDPNKLANEMLI